MKANIEERLIWERMEGVPDPSSNLKLFGHRDAQNELAAAFASGRMHHAWLIRGAKGIGKATLAYRFVNHILHHSARNEAPDKLFEPDAEDGDYRQLAAGAHPNLIHLTRPYDAKKKAFMSALTVDEVRRTQGFFGLTAAGGGWRIAIVDPADDMNASAANALLKILEEPPKKSLFLLTCNAPGQLLPTIRSRCRELTVRPLDAEDMQQALSSILGPQATGQQEIAVISELAEGSVRKAIQLVQGDGLKNYRTFLSLVRAPVGKTPDWPAIHGLADSLSLKSRADNFTLFIDMVMGFLARRVRGQSEPLSVAEPGREFGAVPLARWADVWEKVQNSTRLAETYNLDKKQVILTLFRSIFEAVK